MEEKLSIAVRNVAGIDKLRPVTGGVPIAEGAAPKGSVFVLRDDAGNSVPVQTSILARWKDDSARWVLLDFQSRPPVNGSSNYTLSWEGKGNGDEGKSILESGDVTVSPSDDALLNISERLNAVFSLTEDDDDSASKKDTAKIIKEKVGDSLWTNENLLAEQVASIPRSYRVQRFLSKPLRPFIKLPYIPKPTDIIPSWFLYDLYADSEKDFHRLLASVNNFAYENRRKYFYTLLQNNDQILAFFKRARHRTFTFPYYFLAKGRRTPMQTDKVYIDIRDL